MRDYTHFDALLNQIDALDGHSRLEAIEEVREALHDMSPVCSQPVDRIRWVPVEDVEPNDYNPNSVAKIEMGLLYTSILHDGYTQPVVTIYDADREKYVIVDGFHRYFTCRNNPDIRERNMGDLPIVVLDKPINDRMASTVRHNRARGKHSIDGMSNMVFQMSENGWSEAEICGELGMEAEEVLRLKHITGLASCSKTPSTRKPGRAKCNLNSANRPKSKLLQNQPTDYP